MAMKHLNENGVLYLLQKLKMKFDTKVDKVEGKGLSTNDLTDELKTKILNAGDSSFSGNYDDLSNKPDLSSLHSHANKSVLDGITADKMAAWDGKSDFSGSYHDLTDKPAIPGKVSELANDSGFQTAAEVQSAITAAGHMAKKIVDKLPAAADAQENVLYLVPKADGSGDNIHDEYMLINGKLERIGDTQTDLTGYLKSSDLVEITNAEIDTVWNTVFTAV